jgi:outer membrane protein insertion porin family
LGRTLTIFLLLFLCLAMGAGIAGAEERGKVAVLPFKIHAADPAAYERFDLQKRLSEALERMGYGIAEKDLIKISDKALKTLPVDEILSLGKDLSVEWVISGSVTEVGKKISIDVNIFETAGKRPPFFVFTVAEELDSLGEAMESLAVTADNRISGSTLVDSVRVTGNQRIEKEAILAVVGTKKGDRLDRDQLDRDLRDIYRMKFFRDVKIQTEGGPDGEVVIYNVSEKPSIGKIAFEGNKKIDDDDLKKELGIKVYSILDQNEIKQGTHRLKDHYRQKAYYNAEIEELIEPLPNNEVLLKYRIKENERIYIRKIEFVGNSRYSDRKLRRVMKISEKGFFSWITESGHLDRKKLEFDIHKIASLYHNDGFISAVVGEPQISHREDKGITITIEIQEGNQFAPGKVSVEGDLIQPSDELLKVLKIGKERVFNREIVRKDILALKEAYANEGYAYAEVVPLTEEDSQSLRVDIAYNISKGKKARFGRINISGNSVTRDRVIRRELKVSEGHYFSARDLQRSTQNLHRLGFFEDVEMETTKVEEEELIELNIRVKEQPTGTFSVGAGYSSVDSLVGMVQVSQQNLFGRGQRLTAAMRLGAKTSQFDVTFTEPWLFDTPLSADVQVFKWKREYDDYTKDSMGGALTLGYPILWLDEFTRASVKYTYDDSEITDIDPDAAFVIRDMAGRNVTSSMTFGLSRNSTDRAWNPTRGSVNSITVEYAGGLLGGDNYFNKYTGRSAWYFSFPWDTVFMVQGRLGYAEERSGGNLPVYEKFFLGGMNTVRGFEYAAISPRDPLTGDKIGGEKMMVYNTEFRFPLLKEQGVVGVVFFDAGNVFTADESYTFSGIRMGAGGGIRWYSPIGPLRLEWGYNLDRRLDEPSSQVEFSIGSQW